MGIEPMTSSLPRKRSTAELQQQAVDFRFEIADVKLKNRSRFVNLQSEICDLQSPPQRVMGIEPTYPAWKAGALPLSYTRN